MSPLDRIDVFTSELLLPHYLEVAAQHANVRVTLKPQLPGRPLELLDQTPASRQQGDWIGPTLIIDDAFRSTIVYTIASDRSVSVRAYAHAALPLEQVTRDDLRARLALALDDVPLAA